jgi:tRNA dimethylallyltransferase
MNMIKNSQNKILAIVGPTGSGKTSMAVKLACFFGGEIVSADSRQVYKYMDVGSGKDLKEYNVKIPNPKSQIPNKLQISKFNKQNKYLCEIPHHCIDLVHPNTKYDLVRWRRKAERAIQNIQDNKHLPIITGGTGLYAQALIEGYDLTEIGPDKELRQKLEAKTLKQLLLQLKRLNPGQFNNLNNSEKKNKRHLIRYIEIAKILGVGHLRFENSESRKYDALVLGIKWPMDVLRERIYKRLIDRLENEDMVGEVERLHADYKVSWKRLINFGLEYRFITYYLRNQMSYDEMVEKLNIAIGQFAKRQMSWYRRWEKQGRKIYWVKNINEAKRLVKEHLKQ